ncbi:MAG: hydrogenase formation protein HypD [Deltaproteobacteria bacterium GWF2_42_12]|nr:MAG: hydrogenase formation protein HypD [Deltaproteobacteria bacterium GWD2_42_10]OGP48790.1 MAG: hydrogenase formation protein HypD [Deltaproteobacteria bacterium GWF2_42_12]OGQ28908.1 MAG: hydrogenase formation protein HypD [Deltaproteobacteria bacterium RIFCSPHIGHO2_02_FULL_42_44]OGQ68749.1 MAG: hydrogenase formation protein HypD [Deltaproteobacteria bacterium RIFCSPLOWO2_12_FULL_42_16]OGQ72892.1 MAG: hydrogenase formation protein HypD [Deltaproteobacteria bacterium RIFOXYA2_FULL_42_10]
MVIDSIYKDKTIVDRLSKKIKTVSLKRAIKIMHVCGTHENIISRFGLRDLLPENIEVIAGPGCPVCVCPGHDIELAIELALKQKAIIATFGDMIKVPSCSPQPLGRGSLSDARTQGADIRVVYGPFDAIKIAKENTDKEVVLFAVGFETTACGVASLIQQSDFPKNLSILVSHRLIPPSMEFLLGVGDICIDGFLIPGHVATVMGLEQYQLFPEAYRMPTVAAGFEPVDVLMGILAVVKQTNEGVYKCENVYQRAVHEKGNIKAQMAIKEVFDVVPAYWRGIGKIPRSGLNLKERYKMYDARCRFANPPSPPLQKGGEVGLDINPGCSCHLIMIGKIKPIDCPLFGSTCIPDAPYGPCMVSMDGTCRVWYQYKRVKN